MGLFIIIQIVLSVVVGIMASKRNRSVVGWVLLSLIISSVIVMVILACIGDIYNLHEQYSSEYSRLNNRIDSLEEKNVSTKKCQCCANQINKESVFCQFCGANVGELEEEERIRKRKILEEKGFSAILEDENIMEEAKKIRRLYGDVTYISF